MKKAALPLTLLFLACASKPVVEPGGPNEAQSSQDVKECMAEGKSAVGTGTGKASAKGGLTGGAMGAVGGLVSGIFSGNAVSGALQGGATGAAMGAAGGAVYGAGGDSLYQNYVNMCLQRRGHKVLGWR